MVRGIMPVIAVYQTPDTKKPLQINAAALSK